MKVAVTGAAGMTGGAIVSILLRQGHDVRGIVRRPDARLPLGSERAVADCKWPEQLAAVLDGCDVLVHAAGITLGSGVAGALRRTGTRRVIAVSSAGVYSAHRAASRGYREGENRIAEAAPDVCIVRPTMIYGSVRDRNVHYVIQFARRWGFIPLIGDGQALFQPIYYEDAAAVIAALAGGSATGVVDAGAMAAVTLRDAARVIFAALSQPVRIVTVPVALARTSAYLLDRARGSRLVERVDRMLEDRVVDNTRVVELTGIAPRNFAVGIRDQVAAMAH